MAPVRGKRKNGNTRTAAIQAVRKRQEADDGEDEDVVQDIPNHETSVGFCPGQTAPPLLDYELVEADADTCLHCRTSSEDIQIRCEECQAYICQGCHWCHEYQANHEIRVCDRCDAVFCRNCDEMDQCDDCGEVVCAACSTLLSCKFCGGGLCEECATACGRCGIVLCSRDAKFAVDCDTCRLSYCLVCLASGSKEPCVRCGHRPSKRMEQLVHLRLKSIYKAFKQSSRSSSKNPYVESNATIEELEEGMNCGYDDNSPQCIRVPNSQSMLDGDPNSMAAMRSVDPVVLAAKQKEADAAAEALLAELQEEEDAAKSKKNKKQKKKQRQQAKKEVERKKDEVEQVKEDASVQSYTSGEDAGSDDQREELSSAAQSSRREGNSIDDTFESRGYAVKGQSNATDMDQTESRLYQYVEDSDIDGIESILFELKGVPGRAALRKNAKKALKRLRVPLQNAKTETSLSDDRLRDTSSGAAPRGKAPHKTENVMEIPATLVGWVIGKGGQRIRDLMEASGAKIWIDQEKNNAREPRIVHMSGNQQSVDHAMKLIEDVVKHAPPSNSGKGGPPPVEDVPVQPVIEPVLVEQRNLPPALTVKTGSPEGDRAFEHTMTCEARFVPLLIGKRGWAIKDIQDRSGARVDIDQSVTPRRICISGPQQSVEKAIPMVRDVLNYPHAQPQGALGALETIGGANHLDGVVEKGEHDPDEGRHSPPPSQLIMTGDAKSMISASSSLSSTPEPSMASSSVSKTIPTTQLPNGPLLPPENGQITGLPPPIHVVSNGLPSQNTGLMPGNMAQVAMHPVKMGVALEGNHYPGMNIGPHPSVQHHPKHVTQPGGTLVHGQPLGNFISAPSPLSSVMQHQPEPSFQMANPRSENPLPFNQQGAPLAPFDRRNQMVGSHPGTAMMSGPAGHPRMWHSDMRNQSIQEHPVYPSGNLPTAFSPKNPPGMQDRSFSHPNNRTAAQAAHRPDHFVPPAGHPTMRQDSNLVDSLFAPSTNNKAESDGLLAGLNGLSLGQNTNGAAGSGLWGNDSLGAWNASGNTGTENRQDALASALLVGLPPGQNAPGPRSESRFPWSSTNA